MDRPDNPTPLQAALAASYADLTQARATLTGGEYESYLEILRGRIHNEIGRLVVGEAIRATRDAIA